MPKKWWLFATVVVSSLSLMGGCPAPTSGDGGSNGINVNGDANGSNPQGIDDSGDDGGAGVGGTTGGDDASGGDSGGDEDNFDAEFSGNAQKITPYRDALTADEAYHLLRRAAFGATPEQVQQAVARGLTATVDDLLTMKPIPQEIIDLAETHDTDIPERWLVYLIESPNPLYERMTLFWHDRFATSRRAATDYREHNLPLTHFKFLRQYSLGNYRQFLLQLTLDPLMLLWLDGANSPKDNPNENYAREFWELFTLGRDAVYTEADIVESARAFTGITLLYQNGEDPRPIFDILNHDETNKIVFPQRASAQNHDYVSITDLTLQQPEAARYVARNLFVSFVHDEPSDEMVQTLADGFVAGNFEIAPLVRTILMSQAMFSEAAHGNQITSPVEHVIGVFRTLDMHIHSEESQTSKTRRLADYLSDSGMELLNPPGVEGWTEGAAWLEDQWVLNRVRALGVYMEYGPNRTADLPYHLLPGPATWDEPETRKRIVRAMADVFHLELTPEEEDTYVLVLDQNGYSGFHVSNPEYRYRFVQELIRLMAMDERVLAR